VLEQIVVSFESPNREQKQLFKQLLIAFNRDRTHVSVKLFSQLKNDLVLRDFKLSALQDVVLENLVGQNPHLAIGARFAITHNVEHTQV
jgi:hypothetical protein